jgi:peptide/nickel transport system ATP-binding protein
VACIRLDAVRASARRPESTTLTREPDPAPTAEVARVSGLTKTFGRRGGAPAIDGVTFSIAEGEALGLVGGTGSGKSTIARCLMGLATADSGEIVVGGLDVSDFARLSPEKRREAYRTEQMVFQDPYASLNPKLSIGAALSEALEVRGRDRAEIPELLERVGLPTDYAIRMPHTLSGGERQRVAIARALAIRPRLLICDEPVAALDVSVQAQVLELLRTTQAEQGMSMLFITHDLAVVRQMTTRLLVCHKGVIVEEGPTERVLDHPVHRYTRQLRAAASIPQEERRA